MITGMGFGNNEMIPLNDVYDKKFYNSHTKRCGYRLIAKFLLDLLQPRTVADFGCGIGETLRHLESPSCKVIGIEGSKAALDYSNINIHLADLSKPIDLEITYDLVISMEVAEHLPKSAEGQFISNVTSHSHRAVFFSAAQPGQGGIDHINCQPKEYWAEKFSGLGFERSKLIDVCMKIALYPLVWDLPWIRNNSQLFFSNHKPIKRMLMIIPKYILFSLIWRVRISRWGGRKNWLPPIGK